MQPNYGNLQVLDEKSGGGSISPGLALSSHPHAIITGGGSMDVSAPQDFDPGYFFQTPGWKRFSVTMCVILSIVSLCTGAVAQLAGLDIEITRALLVTGIIINAISVTLSALTSLNWQTPQVQEKQFMERMLNMVNVHPDGQMSLSHTAHSVHRRFGGRKA